MIDIQQFLTQHGNGALLVEVNDAFAKVVKDCCDTGKKGALSLVIAIEPSTTRDGGHQVKIAPNVTTKNPKYDAGIGVFFVVTDDDDNPVALEKDDPRQQQMFMEATKA